MGVEDQQVGLHEGMQVVCPQHPLLECSPSLGVGVGVAGHCEIPRVVCEEHHRLTIHLPHLHLVSCERVQLELQ